MSLSTDTATRQAFITGLRDLADYLDQHPAVPVPANGTEICLSATLTDHGGCAQVDHFARQTGVTVTDNTAHHGPYQAVRSFGPVGYRMLALSTARLTLYQAEASFNGFDPSGLPDTWT
jgi:hypothetical protein